MPAQASLTSFRGWRIAAGMFFHIINHFLPKGAGAYLNASTVFSASLAARSPFVAKVLVVDGSEEANPALEAALKEVGAEYAHAGHSLSFAEGYNFGIAKSDQPWTILSANDIYPHPSVFEVLQKLSLQKNDPSIGCVIPFLTSSDSDFECQHYLMRVAPMNVPIMTLNFNAFPTDYLRSIGGVTTDFSGAYNDALISHRIASDKKRIVLAPVLCWHHGTLTSSAGPSLIDFGKDFARFPEVHPELRQPGGFWGLDLGQFVQSMPLKIWMKMVWLMPKESRHSLGTLPYRLRIFILPWKILEKAAKRFLRQ